MSHLTKGGLLLALAFTTGRLVLSEQFTWFVHARMRWPLLLAAALVAILALVELVHALLEDRADDHHDGAHGAQGAHGGHGVHGAHGGQRVPRVGVLLAVPLVVLAAVAPTGLGAAAAGRSDVNRTEPLPGLFEPLPDQAVVEMRVLEFVQRVVHDEGATLVDRTVQLTGFVVNDADRPDVFRLTRFVVSCCAADGAPVQIVVHGGGVHPDDTWVQVTGTWRAPPDTGPALDPMTVRDIDFDVREVVVLDRPPAEPYESPF